MEQYSKRISKVEEESREIIRTAKIKADAQARDIIEDARKEAGRYHRKGGKDYRKRKRKGYGRNETGNRCSRCNGR